MYVFYVIFSSFLTFSKMSIALTFVLFNFFSMKLSQKWWYKRVLAIYVKSQKILTFPFVYISLERHKENSNQKRIIKTIKKKVSWRKSKIRKKKKIFLLQKHSKTCFNVVLHIFQEKKIHDFSEDHTY